MLSVGTNCGTIKRKEIHPVGKRGKEKMLKNCIKSVRKDQRITLDELHNITGLSRSRLCDIENMKDGNIKASTMKTIGDALGYAPFELFYWDDIPL